MGGRANVLLIIVAAACMPAREALSVPPSHVDDRTGAALSPAAPPSQQVSLADAPGSSPVWIIATAPTSIALAPLAVALEAPRAGASCGSPYVLSDRPLLL
jgi:hypothetical protein